jgi:hypothetical protein
LGYQRQPQLPQVRGASPPNLPHLDLGQVVPQHYSYILTKITKEDNVSTYRVIPTYTRQKKRTKFPTCGECLNYYNLKGLSPQFRMG